MTEVPGEVTYGTRAPRLPASTQPTWGRRVVTIPTTVAAAILAVVFAPVAFVAAAAADVLSLGKLSATRTALFFVVFLWAEVFGLLAAAWIFFSRGGHDEYLAANHALQRRWAEFLFGAARRIFDVEVTVEGAEQLDEPGACLYLVRHASTLDTLIPFVVDPHRRFRYVLKRELLVDPCLDIVGHRVPNCFVERGSDRKEREIHRVVRLGHDVSDDEAVVIFPEGTRYTPAKRVRLVQRMAEKRDPAAPLAATLRHTLSPLRAGALALGASADDLDVVIIAHSGIEAAGSLGDLLTSGLTHRTLNVRVWRVPAREVPRDDDGFSRFLGSRWQLVDGFVASNRPKD